MIEEPEDTMKDGALSRLGTNVHYPRRRRIARAGTTIPGAADQGDQTRTTFLPARPKQSSIFFAR